MVSTQTMDRTIPLILPWDETFDIGSDTGTPVDDQDYQVPFKFTGKIDKLTIAVAPPVLTPADIKKLPAAAAGRPRSSRGWRNGRVSPFSNKLGRAVMRSVHISLACFLLAPYRQILRCNRMSAVQARPEVGGACSKRRK